MNSEARGIMMLPQQGARNQGNEDRGCPAAAGLPGSQKVDGPRKAVQWWSSRDLAFWLPDLRPATAIRGKHRKDGRTLRTLASQLGRLEQRWAAAALECGQGVGHGLLLARSIILMLRGNSLIPAVQICRTGSPEKDEWVKLGEAVVYESSGGIIAGPMHRERE